ncbi:MAG: hypothetical protein ACWA49_05500 [Ruegeria sp.]
MNKRIFILDPSLKDIRGHHFALSSRISRAAVGAGLEVFWGANKEASPSLSAEDITILPTFESDMYAAYRPTNNGLLAKNPLTRLFKRSRTANQTANDRIASYENAFFESVKRCAEEACWTQHDIVLIHTADGATYSALERFCETTQEDRRPVFHICTPYDPVGVMPNRHSAEAVKKAVEALAGHGARLYGENCFLTEHLARIWEVTVDTLPLPVGEMDFDTALASDLRKTSLAPDELSRRMVLCLGSARIEKGFHLLPDVIRRTIELESEADRPPSEATHFVLQATPQIIGYHPVVTTALEKLSQLPNDRVTLLTDPLSEEEYSSWLGACDTILLPYDAKAYQYRGSGIVAEAAIAGKPIVATANSFPARVASQNGGSTGTTPREIASAIIQIHSEYPRRQQQADSYAREIKPSHTGAAYVEKIVQAG